MGMTGRPYLSDVTDGEWALYAGLSEVIPNDLPRQITRSQERVCVAAETTDSRTKLCLDSAVSP